MKISLIGYGKMGRMIEEIALQRGHTISCIIDIDNQEDFESEAFRSSDVAIEFTTPQAAYGNYLRAFAQGVKVVSGSTGWRRDHEEDVRRLIAEGNTLFWASNFSVGVALFSQLNRRLAELMNEASITGEVTENSAAIASVPMLTSPSSKSLIMSRNAAPINNDASIGCTQSMDHDIFLPPALITKE